MAKDMKVDIVLSVLQLVLIKKPEDVKAVEQFLIFRDTANARTNF